MTKDEFEAFESDYEVCKCMCVTLGEIVEAIKNGDDSIDAICESTDAGTACELCQSIEIDEDNEREIHLDEILEQTKE